MEKTKTRRTAAVSYRSRVYGTHVYSARDDDDYDCDYEDDEETLSYRDAPWLVDDDSIYDEDDEDSYHSSWDGNEWNDCLDDENCVGFDDGCEADFDKFCDKTDIIFSYFIENKVYDMIELETELTNGNVIVEILNKQNEALKMLQAITQLLLNKEG